MKKKKKSCNERRFLFCEKIFFIFVDPPSLTYSWRKIQMHKISLIIKMETVCELQKVEEIKLNFVCAFNRRARSRVNVQTPIHSTVESFLIIWLDWERVASHESEHVKAFVMCDFSAFFLSKFLPWEYIFFFRTIQAQ